MSKTIITGIADTAAAHLTVRAAGRFYDEDLTVVWSTRPVECEPGDTSGHITVQRGRDDVPIVWDQTGIGDWDYEASEQCGNCGSRVGPATRLYSGLLYGAALASAAQHVADEAQG